MFVWKEWERRGNAERHGLGLNGYVDTYYGLCLFGLIPLYIHRIRDWTGVHSMEDCE